MKKWRLLAIATAFLLVAGVVAGFVTLRPHRIVALTFDDGPTPGYTAKILDILEKENVKATFFVTGKNAEAHPELIRRIVAEGHTLGNHSYSHTRFDRLTPDQTFNEILGTQQIIEQITGHSPKFVRNPQGVETPAAQEATRRLGLTGTVGWHWGSDDVGNDDWTCRGAQATLKFAQDATRPGAILLAHDANEVTNCPEQLRWLDDYIKWAKTQGYTFGGLRTTDKPNALNNNSWVGVVDADEAQRWNE